MFPTSRELILVDLLLLLKRPFVILKVSFVFPLFMEILSLQNFFFKRDVEAVYFIPSFSTSAH